MNVQAFYLPIPHSRNAPLLKLQFPCNVGILTRGPVARIRLSIQRPVLSVSLALQSDGKAIDGIGGRGILIIPLYDLFVSP